VEALKTVLRRLLQDEPGTDPTLDPSTGRPRINQGRLSTEALFRSLPTELQNLLRRAFSGLENLLRKERQERGDSSPLE